MSLEEIQVKKVAKRIDKRAIKRSKKLNRKMKKMPINENRLNM